MAENTDRNKSLQYSKNDVLSVSGEYGIVNQIALQGRSFAGVSVADYHVVETNDVVYTKSPLKANPYGIIKHNSGVPGIVSTLYAVYHPKSCAISQFIDYYFQNDLRLNKYLKPLVNIGAKHDMKINNEVALTGDVIFPSVDEQAKIVDFLKLIDEKIAKQKQLVEALKSYKRGLSNALFERVIEFCSGSDNKWTQFPLGDLGEFYNGLTGKQKTDFEHGSEPYIPYVNVYKNMVADTSACESVSVSEREHQNKVRYGDILFTQSSETLEEVGLSSVWLGDFEPFLNSFCFGIHFHENLCIFPLYVAHYFRSTDARLKIMHEGQGITRVNLSAERIKAISIPLPPMEVQKKIGMFLKSLNDKINEKQEIICQMEHLKIGLLQQLFI